MRATALGTRALLWTALFGFVPAKAARPPEISIATVPAKPTAMRDSIVALARAQVGRRYVRAGTSPERGFDCSGLVKYVLERLDVSVPRTARQQARLGRAVPRDERTLEPGDILTFGRSAEGASHVAIYVGGGHYVHASVTAGKVIETSLHRRGSPLVRSWRGARRLFTPGDGTVGD